MSSDDEHNDSSSNFLPDMEKLRRFFADKLGLQEKVKVLDDITIDGIVNLIKENKCKNIITLVGAGISTAAGIPDFRSPGTGLYDNLAKYDLPHPESIFEICYFVKNPKPFFVLAKELYPGNIKPTTCHYFIKLLEDKGVLLRHYTQNIDGLERLAGVSDDKIVEAHGTFHFSHCLKCKKQYDHIWMKEKIFANEIPTCENCTGIIKPDIVFFGENLPTKFYKLIDTDFKKCDLLIIMGSSLKVQPFASLVSKAPATCPRLLINNIKVGHYEGLDFDSEDNTRDVAWLGDCQEGCKLLAKKLGYDKELMKMYKMGHVELEKEYNMEEKKSKNKGNQGDDDKEKKSNQNPKKGEKDKTKDKSKNKEEGDGGNETKLKDHKVKVKRNKEN